MKLKAAIVADIDGDDGQQPGAIEFRLDRWETEKHGGIAFRCPCGCGYESYLPIAPVGLDRADRPEWGWDGNRELPTLTPSVLQSGLPCKWHGWLLRGEWSLA